MTELRCLTCGADGAATADGLCARCARAGSEWTGLWDATIWLGPERPATTPEEVRSALSALGWPDCSFEPSFPADGGWLLELPPLHGRLLLTFGHLCHASAGARVEVELP